MKTKDHATAARQRTIVVAVGDVHGDYAALLRIAQAEPAADLLLQVGDYTDCPVSERFPSTGQDYTLLAELANRTAWVSGNHEDWQLLDRLGPDAEHFFGHKLQAGEVLAVGPLHIGGLGGNFARRWFATPSHALPPGERYHFTAEQIAATARQRGLSILAAHEPFSGQGVCVDGADVGQPGLRALVEKVKPRLWLSGHHHCFRLSQLGLTTAVSLPLASEGYVCLVFDGKGNLLDTEQKAL